MNRILIRGFLVSVVATVVALALFLFVFGSFTFFPTPAAAELAGIPAQEQAAWLAANVEVVRGWDYAVHVWSDVRIRRGVLQASLVVFSFGFLCSVAGALLQRRDARA